MSNIVLYDHPNAETGHSVGHLDSAGKVYRHPTLEAGYDVGRVDSDGKIYDATGASIGHCVGHVGSDGRIYNHPNAETGHFVGRADADGRIYSHQRQSAGYCVGHANGGSQILIAGAAYLLLLRNAAPSDGGTPVKPPEPPASLDPPKVMPKKKIAAPIAGAGTAAGWLGSFTGFFVLLIGGGLIYLAITGIVTMLPLFVLAGCILFWGVSRKAYRDTIRRCLPDQQKILLAKRYARSWALSFSAAFLVFVLIFIASTVMWNAWYLAFLPMVYGILWDAFWKRMATGRMRLRPLFPLKK